MIVYTKAKEDMASALDFLTQLLSLAASSWFLVFLYFTMEDYTSTGKMCLSGEAAKKTTDKFKELFTFAKQAGAGISITPPPPVSTLVSGQADHWQPALSGSAALGEFGPDPPAGLTDEDAESADDEVEAFEAELRRLAMSDSMEKQHTNYVNEFEEMFGSRRSMYQAEVEDVDVVNWVGLRRPKYDAIKFGNTSQSQLPSVSPEQMPKSNSLVL